MPKTSFVLTAIVLYWLYLWRTHRKGGTAPTVSGSSGSGGSATPFDLRRPLPPLKTFPPGTVPRLPSIFGDLPFGTPGINGSRP
jgi:hypothetical protein